MPAAGMAQGKRCDMGAIRVPRCGELTAGRRARSRRETAGAGGGPGVYSMNTRFKLLPLETLVYKQPYNLIFT